MPFAVSTPAAVPRQFSSNVLRNQSKARAGKAMSRATVVNTRAAGSWNVHFAQASPDSPLLLPKGQYCESNYQTIRRPTRCAQSALRLRSPCLIEASQRDVGWRCCVVVA